MMIIPTKPFFVEENEALKKKVECLERAVQHLKQKNKILLEQGREDHERMITLQAEADWIAKNQIRCPNLDSVSKCNEETMHAENCVRCWREAAKCVMCWREAAQKAVSND